MIRYVSSITRKFGARKKAFLTDFKYKFFDINYIDLKWSNSTRRWGAICVLHGHSVIGDTKSIVRLNRHETAIVDLTKHEDDIFSRYNATSRNEVRRAMKDGVKYYSTSTPSLLELDEFFRAANDLILLKNVKPKDNRFYISAHSRGELIITKTESDMGAPLSYHVWLRRDKIAFLVNSVTIRAEKTMAADRNFAGRANKLNHWRDALYLRELGVDRLDLGGVQGVFREYKIGLGAEVSHCHNYLKPISIMDRAIIALLNLKPHV